MSSVRFAYCLLCKQRVLLKDVHPDFLLVLDSEVNDWDVCVCPKCVNCASVGRVFINLQIGDKICVEQLGALRVLVYGYVIARAPWAFGKEGKTVLEAIQLIDGLLERGRRG